MSGPMSSSRRRRLQMGAVLLATVLALRLMVSSGTSDSSSDGTTLTGGTAHDVVAVTIASPKTGMTAVEVKLTPREGTKATGSAPVVTVSAVLPTTGHAVPDYAAVRTASNQYRVASLPLMMTGRWEILVDIDGQGRGDHLVFPLTLTR